MSEPLSAIQLISTCIAILLMGILPLFYYRGYAHPDKYEPLNFGGKVGGVDDQDMYAIATGNEDYLAAHCTVTPTPDEIDDIEEEKRNIQRLRNKVARLKLEKELSKLQEPQEPTVSNHLISDCIDALVTLGEKKSQARAKVNKYFLNNPNTKTVDQFISGVFQK